MAKFENEAIHCNSASNGIPIETSAVKNLCIIIIIILSWFQAVITVRPN